MKKLIPTLLAIIAVLNLVWLFVFNYQMPSFFTKTAGQEEQSTEQEALSQPEEGEAQAAETGEEGAEAPEAAPQEAEQQETAPVQAPAGQTTAETAAENTQEAKENPAGVGGTAAQDGEAVTQEGENPADAGGTTAQAGEATALEGQRTCHPADGNTPNIRSGPGSDYGVLRMAAYNEVMIIRGEEEGGWLPIRTQDGLEGYIFAGMLIIDEEPQ